MFTHADGSQIAKLTGAPDEPTEEYKNKSVNIVIPNHTVEKRLINVSATNGGIMRYHRRVSTSPERKNKKTAIVSGSSQTKLPG
jgi:hypothetical protein